MIQLIPTQLTKGMAIFSGGKGHHESVFGKSGIVIKLVIRYCVCYASKMEED